MGLFSGPLTPRLHDFYADVCRSAGFEAKQSAESARTALVPHSVSSDLPQGAIAVPISAPEEVLETLLVWRSDNQSLALAAFVEIASAVFTPEPVRSR